MDINIIRLIFIIYAAIIVFFGFLINYAEPFVPAMLVRIYCYGKFNPKKHFLSTVKTEVPKSWFRHFYIFAAPASIALLFLILYKYLFNGTLPEIVYTVLDILSGASRKPLVPAEDIILAVVILNIHCCKRLYESCYINIFSNQKMDLAIYLVGISHYALLFICIISEAEGFVKDTSLHMHISWDKLRMKLIYGLIFLWLTYKQFETNIILRNLRKSKHSDVVSYDYKISSDGLFKYVSAPLQLTEISIYVLLSMILWEASTFHYITVWVIANQMECAFLSHQWYHATFKNYPKERKILIPYIW